MKTVRGMIFLSGFIIAFGAGLLIFGGIDTPANQFLAGYGTGITAVGAIALIFLLIKSRDKEWLAKFEMKQNDERQVFIANKAARVTFFTATIATAAACGIAAVRGDLVAITYMLAVSAVMLLVFVIAKTFFEKKY